MEKSFRLFRTDIRVDEDGNWRLKDFINRNNEIREKNDMPPIYQFNYLNKNKALELFLKEKNIEYPNKEKKKGKAVYVHPLVFINFIFHVDKNFKIENNKFLFNLVLPDQKNKPYDDLNKSIFKRMTSFNSMHLFTVRLNKTVVDNAFNEVEAEELKQITSELMKSIMCPYISLSTAARVIKNRTSD